MAHAHVPTGDDLGDSELRDSIRTMQRARVFRLASVVLALLAALAVAAIYASLSYSDHSAAPVPAGGR